MDGAMQMLDMALEWALGVFVFVTVVAAIKIRMLINEAKRKRLRRYRGRR